MLALIFSFKIIFILKGLRYIVLDLDAGREENLIANTFFGLGGTAEICKRGLGAIQFVDLCLGGHLFKSLTSAAEQGEFLGQSFNTETGLTLF